MTTPPEDKVRIQINPEVASAVVALAYPEIGEVEMAEKLSKMRFKYDIGEVSRFSSDMEVLERRVFDGFVRSSNPLSIYNICEDVGVDLTQIVNKYYGEYMSIAR